MGKLKGGIKMKYSIVTFDENDKIIENKEVEQKEAFSALIGENANYGALRRACNALKRAGYYQRKGSNKVVVVEKE